MKIILSAKCRDLFNATVLVKDNTGNEQEIEIEGYVPSGLGIGGGDYVELSIDLKTGQIENWKPLSDEEVLAVLIEEKPDLFDDDGNYIGNKDDEEEDW